MLDNKVLIENIKRLCEEHDIKITNLEKELGFGAGIISRWGNDADPSLSKIIQIAEFFNVSLDDIIGYGYIVNDKFLEKLISQTANKSIQWNLYNNMNEYQPKQYFDADIYNYEFLDQNDINNFLETNKEISYYYKVNNGYISIYGFYQCHDIINPKEIKLFIQPDYESELIEQDYSYDQLKVLWLKILYNMKNDAPDEIKAEEFKNNFINGFEQNKKPLLIKDYNPVKVTQNLINTIINSSYDFMLYDLYSEAIIKKSDFAGTNFKGIEFYNKYKNELGDIKKTIYNINGVVLLIADYRIMKLSNISYEECTNKFKKIVTI